MRRPIDIESVWSKLSQVDVSEHCATKGGFTYLSWSWAWSYVKDHYPDATFEKHLFDGLPYMVDGQGFAYVQVTVTIEQANREPRQLCGEHRTAAVPGEGHRLPRSRPLRLCRRGFAARR